MSDSPVGGVVPVRPIAVGRYSGGEKRRRREPGPSPDGRDGTEEHAAQDSFTHSGQQPADSEERLRRLLEHTHTRQELQVVGAEEPRADGDAEGHPAAPVVGRVRLAAYASPSAPGQRLDRTG